ncbi:hypothetical protein GCM10007103_07010 [Salinimicrobium marinum]|uniref:Uncharacterized protein n=1 Tax=Salinimicrobium marinum TaxID=680283 RepID=A0A918S9V1_9FLAO|nr:hypothetical protein [Salinimicrobium marinum]GHA28087.1 hypothetical protein GCM10007103_07010 [Salinimicrobium marinum]
MRLFYNICVFCFIYFSGTLLSFSQESDLFTSELGSIDKEKQYSALALQDWKISESQLSSIPSGNNIFIEQIGNNNRVNAQISSPNLDARFTQAGMGNEFSIDLNAEKVKYTLVQSGDNNYLLDHTFAPSRTVELSLQQNGNNNHVEKYGTNSITNKLEFNLTGDSKSLIIRSFQ